MYKWTSINFKADANKVGQELEKIESRKKINIDNIINFAKTNTNSELHKCFEWDDSIAGEKYRRNQCSQILASISIVVDKEQKETLPKYVNIKIGNQKTSYKNIISVLNNNNDYETLVNKYEKELYICNEKYKKIINLKDRKEILLSIYNNMD